MTTAKILAPAKVNLGLAILGRRGDGYHEIDTIMAMIDLYDEITISASARPNISIAGMDYIPVESNLMTKAARLWSAAAGVQASFHIEIKKQIPSAAGIGGGSSDAAAVLRALNVLHDQPLDHQHLHQIAAQLGADCPFFLQGPAARATGIGTELRNISAQTGWLVMVAPRSKIQAKTARMYGELQSRDYGTSDMIDAIERDGIQQETLPNSFLRPAMQLFPDLAGNYGELQDVAGNASLSGAGPTMYCVGTSSEEASEWAESIDEYLLLDNEVIVASLLADRPEVELNP